MRSEKLMRQGRPRCLFVCQPLPLCGWEDRDLRKLLTQRKAALEETGLTSEELSLLQAISRMTLSDTHLKITTSAPETLGSYLQHADSALPATLRNAIAEIRTTAHHLTVMFPRVPKPPFYDGDNKDHKVACHLYRSPVSMST